MSSTLNFDDVQGDILVGLPKKVQQYFIFQIDSANVVGFKRDLGDLIPSITTATQVMQDRSNIAANKKAAQEQGTAPELLPLTGVNIAFSHAGLTMLGINDNIRDDAFAGGQKADAKSLGDPGHATGLFDWQPDWDPAFLGVIHGVILISGDSDATITATRQQIEKIFKVGTVNATMHEAKTLSGNVRPGDQKGHEHFGFMDGISQPAVKDVDTKPNPGQDTVRQGIILCGRDGDDIGLLPRPSWAKDGSFMCLRWLHQRVPEFNAFLQQNALKGDSLTPEQGGELLGARLMGRWKSGAPVDITPDKDDPVLAADANKNNNFNYNTPNNNQGINCPLAAHTRKGNPRHDLADMPIPIPLEPHRIIRRGIPFGPELTPDETSSGTTQEARGLIFVCYQSNLLNGFTFIQKTWANQPLFPPKGLLPPIPFPGYDPIIGQDGGDESGRSIASVDPSNPKGTLTLPTPEWVVPKGGEYFFAPSLPALRSKFATV